jgi:hypothetical protein
MILRRARGLSAALVVSTALGIGSCGQQTGKAQAPSATTHSEATATPSPRAWHLIRRPIVVVSRPQGADAPSYEVYFRLDHPLPSRRQAVLVRLNGVSNFDTSGTGYDGFTAPSCYTKAIDNFKDFPGSLRRPRADDRMTVSLRFRTPPRGTVTAHVPLQVAGPQDPGWDTADPARLRALGCAT